MESRHELRKQKKKLQKRKRAQTSVTQAAKRTQASAKPGPADNDDGDSGDDSGDEGQLSGTWEENRDAKLVKMGASSDDQHAAAESHVASDVSARPIMPYLEGKETRTPGEVFAWMIAPITTQQFFEFVAARLIVIRAEYSWCSSPGTHCCSLNHWRRSEYWEKKPLLIKRRKRNYFRHLFSTEAMDEVMRKARRLSPSGTHADAPLQNYLKYTVNLDIARYENGVRETLNPEGRAHSHVVWDFFQVRRRCAAPHPPHCCCSKETRSAC